MIMMMQTRVSQSQMFFVLLELIRWKRGFQGNHHSFCTESRRTPPFLRPVATVFKILISWDGL